VSRVARRPPFTVAGRRDRLGGLRVNPMPDHWTYVLGAYGVTAVALLGYWRHLAARARGHGRRTGARRA